MRKPKTLKGAVLIMVLTVMTIILVLCGAALALSITINNRTANKYSDNQAYFAARSALSSTLACIQNYTGEEDDQYVQLAKRVVALAEGNTNDYFVGETTIDLPPSAGVGVSTPVQLRFENIDEEQNLVKLTATATYAKSGNASVSVVFSVGENIPANTFSNALTTCGNASGVNISAYGGSAINLLEGYSGQLNLTNDGAIIGSTIINGDASLHTQTVFKMEKGQYFVCARKNNKETDGKTNLNIANLTCFSGIEGVTPDGDNPYVYVSGNLNLINTTSAGLVDYSGGDDEFAVMSKKSPNQVDVHCNTLTGSAAALVINGNLYIHGTSSDIRDMFLGIDGNTFAIQKLIIMDGNIYFDSTDAMEEWKKSIQDYGSFQNGIFIDGIQYGTNPDGAFPIYESYGLADTDHSGASMADKIVSPYEELQNFQDQDADGNYIFNGDTPVLVPVKSCPANATFIEDYLEGGEYVIDTGTDGLINIDLSDAHIQNRPIIVKGTGKCNFFVRPGKTFTLEGSSLVTEEIYGFSSNGKSYSNLKIQSGEGSLKSPNINMYLEDGSTLNLTNNSMISGYVYGPKANINARGLQASFTYQNENCGTKEGVSFIGAVICEELDSGGANFIALYLPQDGGGDDAAKGADGSDIRFKYYSN